MTFEPESIKDLICLAVLRLGEDATRQAIGREGICNDSVMQIALDSMLNGGHLVPGPEGITLQLSEALRTEYPAAGYFVTAQALPALARDFKCQARAQPREDQHTKSGGDHMATKTCRTCGDELELTDANFRQFSISKDGFRHDCIDCEAKKRAERQAALEAGAPESPPAIRVNVLAKIDADRVVSMLRKSALAGAEISVSFVLEYDETQIVCHDASDVVGVLRAFSAPKPKAAPESDA